MADDESRSQIEISTDDDWKNRVKAEAAALDAQFQSGDSVKKEEKPPHAPRESRTSPPLPRADFAALLGLLSTQALATMGAFPDPATGKSEKQLSTARYLIDLIGVLEEKTAGNLSPDEASMLEESLHSLRMAYITRSRETD